MNGATVAGAAAVWLALVGRQWTAFCNARPRAEGELLTYHEMLDLEGPAHLLPADMAVILRAQVRNASGQLPRMDAVTHQAYGDAISALDRLAAMLREGARADG